MSGLRKTRSGAFALVLTLLVGACGEQTPSGGSAGPIFQLKDACTAQSEKQFVLDQVRDWYFFPETLPSSVDPDDFADGQELLDYLTATARSQGRDRYFSYLTSASGDSARFEEGQYVGFGFSLLLEGTSLDDARLLVRWSFKDSAARNAGMLRNSEITAIDSGNGFHSVHDILAEGGFDGLDAALGSDQIGLPRGFRWRLNGADHEVHLIQGISTITPIADNGGAKIIPRAGTPGVGYLHLMSFISPAEEPLREAFAQFSDQGITDFIIDLRYNGGGLVQVEELLGNLLGKGRNGAQVFSRGEFNSRHAEENWITYFLPQPESVAPLHIAFITTGSSASASESIINSMKPYADVAIIGDDTYGKPVGQIGLEMPDCDRILRLIAFRIVNKDGEGDYYDGLADTLPGAACAADDDLDHLPGEASEDSTEEALSWLEHGSCSAPIAFSGFSAKRLQTGLRQLPLSPRPRSEICPDCY